MAEFAFDNVLRIGEIVSFIGGGLLASFKVGKYIEKVEQAVAHQTDTNKAVAKKFDELHAETKKIAEVLGVLSLQTLRLDMHDKWIDELRRGIGLIIPDRRLDPPT